MKFEIAVLFITSLISHSSCYDFEGLNFNPSAIVLEPLKNVLSKNVDQTTCDDQLKLFSDALARRETWAVRLFDTWAKIDTGYLVFNLVALGHYTECVRFRHKSKKVNPEFQGQHCLVTLSATHKATIVDDDSSFDWRELGAFARNFSLILRKGICVPATCSPDKVVEFANTFVVNADLLALSASCQTNDPLPFEVIDYVAIVIFSILGLLMVVSTVYDVFMRYKDSVPHILFISFSAYTNGRKLFDIVENKSPNAINCLNGLRAISVFWIVFGHRIGNQANFPIANFWDYVEFFDTFSSVIVSAYTLAVDTFFLMGGLLVTISVMQAHEKGRLNILRMIYHRYIRYTPVWAVLLLYTVSIGKFFVSGHFTAGIREPCVRLWWATLLHIQNYVDANDMCLNFSWYLSADFQLFIFSPFLIYPAIKYGQKYLWSIPLLGFMSTIYVLVMSLVFEIHAVGRTSRAQEMGRVWLYFPTHARIAPWMIGITLGYALFKLRNKKLKIDKSLNAALWTISLSLLIVAVATTFPMTNPLTNQETSLISNALYLAFFRLIWSLGVAWIIFACHQLKTGGILKWFLELRHFQPICRMGLSIYLVHCIYQLNTMMNNKQALFLGTGQMMHLFWGDIVVSIVLGAFLYCQVETPILLIDDYFWKKLQTK